MVITTSIRKPAKQPVMAGRMVAIAVRGESLGDLETGRAAGDEVEDAGADNRADDLRDDVGDDSFAGKRPPAVNPIVTAGLRWQPEIWPIA